MNKADTFSYILYFVFFRVMPIVSIRKQREGRTRSLKISRADRQTRSGTKPVWFSHVSDICRVCFVHREIEYWSEIIIKRRTIRHQTIALVEFYKILSLISPLRLSSPFSVNV